MWTRIKPILASVVQNHYTPVALAIIVALLYLRYAPQRPPAYQPAQGPVTVATEPKIVTRTVTRTVKVPGPERIVYLSKPEAAAALNMPVLATSPDNVLAIVTVPPHAGPTTAVSILSPTGEGTILLRQEPQKFLELKKQFSISARYLFVGRNLLETDLIANPLRVGPVEVEGGVGMEVRRDDSALGARGYVGFTYRF